MKCLVIGASAGLGRAITEELAARGHKLSIVSSDESDLASIAKDLKLRHSTKVSYLAMDLTQINIKSFLRFVEKSLGSPDAIFCIAGYSKMDLDKGPMDHRFIDKIININLSAPIKLVYSLIPRVKKNTHFVFAGSVSAIRPRKSNIVYSSSKVALENFSQCIRHAYANKISSVCCYRIGYMQTSMLFDQKLMLPAIQPMDAARRIIENIGKKRGVVYLPRWWRIISIILNALPWFIYKRLNI